MTNSQDVAARRTRVRSSVDLLIALAWSMAFGALLLAVEWSAWFGSHAIGQISSRSIAPLFHGGIMIAGMAAVTWLVRVKINKGPWAGMALPRPQFGLLLAGCLCGAFVILAISGIEYALGWLHFARIDTSPHRGTAKIALILLELVTSLGIGFSEELAFRGYVFQTLGERMPVWCAALVTGVIFGLIHFSLDGFSISFVFSVLLISTMFLAMRFATGSLWFPIGFHALWDWTQTYLVGIGNVGSKGYDPSLVQVYQSGPALWVGGGQTLESGLNFILATVAVTLLILAYASRVGRPVRWTQRLDPSGEPARTPQSPVSPAANPR